MVKETNKLQPSESTGDPSTQVFDQFLGLITSGKLPVGAKISESEFAQQFQTGRQPIREALIRLADLGYVSVRPRRATVVLSAIGNTIGDHALLEEYCEELVLAIESLAESITVRGDGVDKLLNKI